ncbi:MAG: FKBP-type peptidyl-prolyl cis-trans isomerase [Sandaracinaceae bacterium]|nr:FKBP-type peptidyl-prolyl cis-trans isomerase [Sandaracinaceae bacterium]
MSEKMLCAIVGLALGLAGGCGADPDPTPTPDPEPAPEATPDPAPDPDLIPLPIRPDAIPAPAETRSIPSAATMDPTGRFASRVLVEGEGTEHPRPFDGVVVHSTSWRSADGNMFDTTRGDMGEPPRAIFMPDLFPALREGVQLMVQGETRRFWFPQDPPEAGGPAGRPEGLIAMDVELVELHPAPEPPESLTEPPASAGRSASGLRWVVVEPGTGTEHPEVGSRVRIHYTGWSADTGEIFAGTYVSGQPWRRVVQGMIPGLREGVPLMVVGERRLFWVPAELAYEGQEERPQGMLVFLVELVSAT